MTSSRRPPPRTSSSTPVDLVLEGPANGGASVARDAMGRVVFCDGGLPGETVRVALDIEKKRFARGRVVEVLDESPGRVEPTCPTHRRGCGGCDLAHATKALQHEIKRRVVSDALVRIARCAPDDIERLLGTPSGAGDIDPYGYRTTVRAAINDGRAGYRKRASHEVVAASHCGIAHPLVEDMLVNGRFGPAAGPEVVFRASASTGERCALVDGDVGDVELPDDVLVTSRDELAAGRRVSMIERAAGRDWQVSIDSFFQAGPTIATALVASVAAAAGQISGLRVVDAYGGIGLFGGTVASTASDIWSVERSGSSTRDARRNLAELPATVVECAVEEWPGVAADVVIADPARSGLGKDGVTALITCAARRFVLVSCDTGSLGRDVGLLREHGYTIDSIEIVDAFPDTSHVETIVGLVRD